MIRRRKKKNPEELRIWLVKYLQNAYEQGNLDSLQRALFILENKSELCKNCENLYDSDLCDCYTCEREYEDSCELPHYCVCDKFEGYPSKEDIRSYVIYLTNNVLSEEEKELFDILDDRFFYERFIQGRLDTFQMSYMVNLLSFRSNLRTEVQLPKTFAKKIKNLIKNVSKYEDKKEEDIILDQIKNKKDLNYILDIMFDFFDTFLSLQEYKRIIIEILNYDEINQIDILILKHFYNSINTDFLSKKEQEKARQLLKKQNPKKKRLRNFRR